MSDKAQQIVKEMAKLTMLSNRISEIQEKNLKMYPLVVFNEVQTVKIDYDLTTYRTGAEEGETRNNSQVSFYVDLDESKQDNIEKRFNYLEAAVRNLFWADLTVKIYINNTLKFESKKNV